MPSNSPLVSQNTHAIAKALRNASIGKVKMKMVQGAFAGATLYWIGNKHRKEIAAAKEALQRLENDSTILMPASAGISLSWLKQTLPILLSAQGASLPPHLQKTAVNQYNTHLEIVARAIDQPEATEWIIRAKRKAMVRLAAELIDLLRTFKKLSDSFLFTSEKYIIYRILKQNRRPVIELRFPTSFEVFTVPSVRAHLARIKQRAQEYLIALSDIQAKIPEHPGEPDAGREDAEALARIGEQYLLIDYLASVCDALLTQDYNHHFQGQLEVYNAYFRTIVNIFHKEQEVDLALEIADDALQLKKFGYYLSEHGGFGDLLNTVKMYALCKSLLPQCEHILVYHGGEPRVKRKMKDLFPQLELIAASKAELDICFAFMRSDSYFGGLRAKIVIPLSEYESSGYRNDADFTFGFGEKKFGILPAVKYNHTKEDVIAFMRNQQFPNAQDVPYAQADWSLTYWSSISYSYIMENVVHQIGMHLERPLIFFVVKDQAELAFDEQLGVDTVVTKGEDGSIYRITHINKQPVPQPIFFICMNVLPHEIFATLLSHCNMPCVVTGDQSLTEAIHDGKLFYYHSPSWKLNMFEQMRRLLVELGYADVTAVLEAFSQFTYNVNYSPQVITDGASGEQLKKILSLWTDQSLQQRFVESMQRISFLSQSLVTLLALSLEVWKRRVVYKLGEVKVEKEIEAKKPHIVVAPEGQSPYQPDSIKSRDFARFVEEQMAAMKRGKKTPRIQYESTFRINYNSTLLSGAPVGSGQEFATIALFARAANISLQEAFEHLQSTTGSPGSQKGLLGSPPGSGKTMPMPGTMAYKALMKKKGGPIKGPPTLPPSPAWDGMKDTYLLTLKEAFAATQAATDAARRLSKSPNQNLAELLASKVASMNAATQALVQQTKASQPKGKTKMDF